MKHIIFWGIICSTLALAACKKEGNDDSQDSSNNTNNGSFLGTYRRIFEGQGSSDLVFDTDSTFHVVFTSGGSTQTVAEGHYIRTDIEITFVHDEGWYCEGVEGLYIYAISGNTLAFSVVQDLCAESETVSRSMRIHGTWDKIN